MLSPNIIKNLWELNDLSENSEIKQVAQDLRNWLASLTDDPIAQFLAGESNQSIESPDEPITDSLEEEICHEFKSGGKENIYLTAFAVVLNRGIQNGVFNICPPRLPTLYEPPKSPFQPESLHLLADVRRWRKCLHQTIIPLPRDEPEVFIGQIILSAIINGGVLHHRVLKALFKNLHEPLELLLPNGHRPIPSPPIFMDLPIPRPNGATPEFRRWFPDYFTETLLYKLPQDKLQDLHEKYRGDKLLANRLSSCIKKFFHYAGVTDDKKPKNVKTLLEAALFEMQTKLPMFVCQYAAGKVVSHSLRQDVWKRIHGLAINRKHVEPAQEEIEELKQAEDDEKLSGHKAFKSVQTPPLAESQTIFDAPWLKDLRHILAKGRDNSPQKDTRTIVKQEIKQLNAKAKENPFSPASVFIGWAQFMLTGNKVAFSIIREYLGHIANRIIGYIGNEDITTLEGEGLEEIYHQILDEIENYDNRSKVARGLGEFHKYLVEIYHMAPINNREVLGIGPLHSKVDANIITIDEYQAIHHQLDRQNLEIIHPDFHTVVKLIFTLAFRCGLRRLEVLKLLIDDFHDSKCPTLLIRNNFARRLKTENALRNLPLNALLEPDELNTLRKFYLKRRMEKSDPSHFLFSIPGLSYEIVPEQRFFDIIRDTMRQVTGDATLTLYNLRHSFASWTTLRLVIADQGLKEDVFPHLPETTRYLQHSTDFQVSLFRGIPGGRRNLYALADLMGHASPKTTLEHYIHFMGLICRLLLRRSHEKINRAALINNSNMPASSAQRWYKNGGINEFMRKLRNKQDPQRLQLNQYAVFPLYLTPKETCPITEKIRNIWTYLYLTSVRSELNKSMLRHRLILSQNETENIERTSKRIRQLKPKSKIGHRHHLSKIFFHNHEKRILCPPWPRLRQEQAILEQYAPKVWQLYETDREFLLDILVLFVKNSWYSINEIIFHNFDEAEAARNFMIFLNKVGINKKHLCFISFDHSSKSIYRKRWRQELGLTWRDKIEYMAPRNIDSPATQKWFGIAPMFLDPKSGRYKTSSGYRFLMLMTAIHANYAGYVKKQ